MNSPWAVTTRIGGESSLHAHEPECVRGNGWNHSVNRAIRVGDWKLVADYPSPWELYNLAMPAALTTVANKLKLKPGMAAEYKKRQDAAAGLNRQSRRDRRVVHDGTRQTWCGESSQAAKSHLQRQPIRRYDLATDLPTAFGHNASDLPRDLPSIDGV